MDNQTTSDSTGGNGRRVDEETPEVNSFDAADGVVGEAAHGPEVVLDGELMAEPAASFEAEVAARSDAAPAAEAGDGTPPTLEDVLLELERARRLADSNQEAMLRARAELDNLRKRAERDVANAHRHGLERIVAELLPVRDSLELGLGAASAGEADVAKVQEGLELTLRMLDTATAKFGVLEVDPVGQPFDPEFHQAVSVLDSEEADSGTVVQVIQKGCLLNDRLVRPAMVIVAR